MADRDLVQNQISRLGTSQGERLAAELREGFVGLDERTPADLLAYLGRLAPLLRYYQGTPEAAAGDWTPFFPAAAELARLPERDDGTVPPHLALLAAFAELYELPRAALNRIPGRHLDFFYRRVLGLAPRAAVPDRAHLLIELKKGSPPVVLGPGHAFSAGKDARGVERLYVPAGDTVLRPVKVASLRSVFVDAAGTVRCAPLADSADGLGGALPAGAPWRAFGHPDLRPGEIGFAVASPVLRMQQGSRRVELTLELDGLPQVLRSAHPRADRPLSALSAAVFETSLAAYLTGAKGWLGPWRPTASVAGDALTLAVELPAGDPAVVDYSAALHGYAYAAQAPVLQLLVEPAGPLRAGDLRGLAIRTARLAVTVAGATALLLDSDAGTLDPTKSFLPFGPQPVAGSRFQVGSAEAFGKKLSRLELRLQWQGLPASFAQRYQGYSRAAELGSGDDAFTVAASFEDGGGWRHADSGRALFAGRTAAGETTLSFERPGAPGLPRSSAGAQVATLRTLTLDQAAPREGFLTLTLERDFLHADYRQETVANVVTFSKAPAGAIPTVLAEPYTPTVRAVALGYTAQSDTADLATGTPEAFARPDLQFFHLGCFGPRREHAYLRRPAGAVGAPGGAFPVPLLPFPEAAGELLIGLAGLAAGESVSLLFQAAEGSADPDLPREEVHWSVLADDRWQPLSAGQIARETTGGLLTSGIVGLVIPSQATTGNTFLPAGLLWLRAEVAGNVEAVSRLIAVAANAVEVRFVDRGNDPAHLDLPLPAGSIARLKAPVAAVKALHQPYASFGGRPAESDAALRTRAAERLRHRNRCLTPWDYERIVLDAFPAVHRVKCIPHASPGSWLAPGHVLVVVVPDLRNRNAVDLLRPRVDAATLARLASHLESRSGMQVAIHVENPRYQRVQVACKVRFRPGYEPALHRRLVAEELTRFLSPWAFDAGRPLAFGGRIYKSVLLDFVEDLEPVDVVTDFRMFTGLDGDLEPGGIRRMPPSDLDEVQAETPDTILVSARDHLIEDAV
jgi:Baseplate J-like protein